MEHIKKLIQYGNKKLPKTTAIFNLGSALSCASDKLNLCAVSKQCYAKKAEVQYKHVTPYRNRQRDKWLKHNATLLAFEFMETFEKKRNKINMIRFNESGDFYSQDCVNKMESIARKMKASMNIKCYVYTARKDLDFSDCKTLVVNGSGFRKEGVNRSFTAVKDVSIDKTSFVCPMDCNSCNKCSINDNENIIVGMH